MDTATVTNPIDNPPAGFRATPAEERAVDAAPASQPAALPPAAQNPSPVTPPRHSESVRRAFRVITIALFLAAIGLPLVDMVLHLDRTPSSEKRALAPFPTKVAAKEGLGSLPTAIKRYCEDNFGFRNMLIRLHGLVKVKGFGVTSSTKVVLGKVEAGVPAKQAQWLYYAENKTIEHYRAIDLFTEQELEQWRWVFEQRRDWLAKRGCKYLVVVAPNSQEINPEFLPDSITRVGRQTRTDQLFEYLRKHQVVEIVDTRAALREARNRNPGERLFHRTDTHWNDLGSFAGYQAIMPSLRKWYPQMQPLTREQFELKPQLECGGDLAGTLGIPDQYEEIWLNLEPTPPLPQRVPREQWHDKLIELRAGAAASAPRGPKLLMFRDSFGATMVPYLAQHFSDAVFSWTDQFHRGRVEMEKPDVVITQFIERLLMRPPPTDWSVE